VPSAADIVMFVVPAFSPTTVNVFPSKLTLATLLFADVTLISPSPLYVIVDS
jgi:hypothetical protein